MKWSLYQIAQIVNRVGNYDPQHLMGCPRIEAGPIPPRAGNVTMDSSKLEKALGRKPFLTWPLRPDHHPSSREWHFERDHESDTSEGEGFLGSVEAVERELYYRPI